MKDVNRDAVVRDMTDALDDLIGEHIALRLLGNGVAEGAVASVGRGTVLLDCERSGAARQQLVALDQIQLLDSPKIVREG